MAELTPTTEDKTEAKDSESFHAEVKELYSKAMLREENNTNAWREAMRVYEGSGQWPEAVRREREAAGKPCLTFNQFPQFVNQVTNEIRKNPPQIKVRPVDAQADVQTAEMFGGLIRNIEDQSQANQIYEAQGRNAVIGGWGAFMVNFDYYEAGSFYPEIRLEGIENPLDAVCGPYCKPDASDAEYWFTSKLVTKGEYTTTVEDGDWEADYSASKDLWRDDDKIRIASYWHYVEVEREYALTSDGSTLDVTEKTPEGVQVVATKKRKVKKVRRTLMTGNRVIKTEDWPGSIIPIVAVIGEEARVDGEVFRSGLVKNGIDAQRAYNMTRSTVIEKARLGPKAPWVGPVDAFKGLEDVWNTANEDNHAWLPYNGNIPPQRVISDTVSQGEMALAAQAAADLKSTMGINDAGLGMGGAAESGAALKLKRKEADTSIFNWGDNLSRSVQFAGRILVDLIPKVYTNQRYARLKNIDDTTRLVQLNVEYIDPEQGKLVFYDLSRGCYDVAVSTGQSFSTMREESAEALTELVRAVPESAAVLGPRLLETLDFPQAKEIAAELRQASQAKSQGAPPDPLQLAQQIEAIKAQSSIQVKQATAQAEIQLQQAKFQLEHQAAQEQAKLSLQIAQQNAQLDMAKLDRQLEIKQQESDSRLHLAQQEALLRVNEARAKSLPEELVFDSLTNPEAMNNSFAQLAQALIAMAQTNQAMMQQSRLQNQQLITALTAPREAIRDAKGNMIGSRIVAPAIVEG